MSSRLCSQFLRHLLKIAMESEGYEFLQFVETDFLDSSPSAMKTLLLMVNIS